MGNSDWIRAVSLEFVSKLSRRSGRQSRHKVARAGNYAPELMEPRLLLSSYTFNSVTSLGTAPNGGVAVDASGDLFGTTVSGGAGNVGTLYEIPAGSNNATTLAEFNGPDGVGPAGPLVIDSNGNIWGTTTYGGIGYTTGNTGSGVVFEYQTTNASFAAPIQLSGTTQGSAPQAGLVADSHGNFYGTTSAGGSAGDGTIFKISNGILTTLAGFAGGSGGAGPIAPVAVDSSGNIFGTTSSGGNASNGTVFKLPAGSSTITTVVTMNSSTGVGGGQVVLDAGGNLFGTTSNGGIATDGSIFEIPKGSTTLTTFASFTDTDGTNPNALVFDAGGDLFGSTVTGGSNEDGTAFEIPKGSNAITSVVSFDSTNNGQTPVGITIDSAGNIFGATQAGGNSGTGTVYELASSEQLTFTSPPTFDTQAGATLGGPNGIIVTVGDAFGHAFTVNADTVTATLTGGTFADGTNTEMTTAINGVAYFSSLTINVPGNYSLAVTDAPLSPISSAFSVYILNSMAALVPNANGAQPAGAIIMDAGGNLFGTTEFGGSSNNGTVFEIPQGSTDLTVIASFNGANGANPIAAVTFDSNGNLWGTTQNGGAGSNGTVFEIPQGSSTITAVASFDGADGANPFAPVTFDSSGNLWGTTVNGGSVGFGAVFEIPQGSTSLTAVVSFDGTAGFEPVAAVTFDTSGNLFGTTEYGGTGSSGTVFEIPSGSTTATTVANFDANNDATAGQFPVSPVTIDSSGNLFGTTQYGGSSNNGTVFEVAAGSTSTTTVASFDGSNGQYPVAGVTFDKSGNLFGTTQFAGTNLEGAVFEIPNGSTSITTVASFDATDGQNPTASVVVDSSGNLFGTAGGGGPSSNGTVFEIPAGTASITALNTFQTVEGANPVGLTVDSSGDVFGTTNAGGSSTDGTVFEVPGGSNSITTLASFDGANGGNPQSSVTIDSSGNLFGTTEEAGAAGNGTVFEITNGSNVINTIATFTGDNGANPIAGVTFDAGGDMFGTTSGGGDANSDGTVFEIPSGSTSLTSIAFFDTATSGANPRAGITIDASGNLFGTTTAGGADGYGTVFEIPQGSNSITVIATFNGANGASPGAGVTFDPSGNLWGTTYFGGLGYNGSPDTGDGTLFEIPKGSSNLTTVVDFNVADGQNPQAAVTFDSSGNLFGTTWNGGSATSAGEVFEILKGTSTVITLTGGQNFADGVAFDSSGDLFAATYDGGTNGFGTLLELAPSQQLTFAVPPGITPATSVINGSTGVQVVVGDALGRPFIGNTDTVTLTLNATNSATFADGGTTETATAADGLATFNGLVINTPGGYTTTATDGTLAPTTSGGFLILSLNSTINLNPFGPVTFGNAYAPTATVIAGDNGAVTYTYYNASDAILAHPLAGAPTAAGSYQVTGTVAANGTFAASTSNPESFSIVKATPIATAIAPANPIYTNAPVPATATVTGVSGVPTASLEGITPTLTYYAGATATGTPLGGAPTNVGTYTVVASFAGSADYKKATSAPVTFTILIPNPPSIANTAFSINAKSLLGTQVGNVGASSTLPGAILSYSLSGTNAAAFQINSSGQLAVAISSLLPGVAKGTTSNTAKFNVTVTDSISGLSTTQPVTVTLNTVQAMSPVFNTTTLTMNHLPVLASTKGTAVGTIAAAPAYTGQLIKYSLTGTDASLFLISTAGVITVKSALALAFNYSFNVVATDGTSASTSQVAVTLNITEASVSNALPNLTVADNVAAGKPFAKVIIGDVVTTHNVTVTISINPAFGSLVVGTSKFIAGTGLNAGTYTFTGTAAAATKAIILLTFTPARHLAHPTYTYMVPMTVTVTDAAAATAGTATLSPAAVVTVVAANTLPTITGTPLSTAKPIAVLDTATSTPFSTVGIVDPDFAAFETVTVSLDVAIKGKLGEALGYNGTAKFAPVVGKSGSYSVTGTPAQVTSAIDALTYTPAAYQVAPGVLFTTLFTISVSDGIATTATTNAATKVNVTQAPDVAPTVTIGSAAWSTTDKTADQPLAGTTVVDPDAGNTKIGTIVGQIETVTITESNPALGKLSGMGVTAAKIAGTYTITGTVTAVNAEMNTAVFTPSPSAVPSGSTGTETLTVNVTDAGKAAATKSATTAITISASFGRLSVLTAKLAGTLKGTLAAGTAVATLATNDPDTADVLTYVLTDATGLNSNDNSLFAIGGVQNNQLVVGGSPLPTGVYHVVVQATDAGGDSVTQGLTVTIGTSSSTVALAGSPIVVVG